MKTKEELDEMSFEELKQYQKELYELFSVDNDFLGEYINERELSREHLSVIEKEFMEVYDEVYPKIRRHLVEAKDHLCEAMKLSNQSGVPFRSNLSPLRQNYWPRSFRFEIIQEFIEKNTGVSRKNENHTYWENSDNACADW